MLEMIKKIFSKFKNLGKFPKLIISTICLILALFVGIFVWVFVDVIANPEEYTTTATIPEILTAVTEELAGSDSVSVQSTTLPTTNLNSSTTTKYLVTTTKRVDNTTKSTTNTATNAKVDLSKIPAFSNNPYVKINNNQPGFSPAEMKTTSFEKYSSLDSKGRCGFAYACIGKDLMPTDERGQIGQVKPSGWHTVKYAGIDGNYLYNRCHLIGWQLTGENANEKNLITGTRYMNIEGMLPFENMVADYIKETGNHVLYRVTPIFKGNNLLASGVQIEAYSVEDNGDGICFNVYCYNAQPGITIDYSDGSSSGPPMTEATTKKPTTTLKPNNGNMSTDMDYVLNMKTKKFHYPTCKSVNDMKEENKEYFIGSRQDVIDAGYNPCGNCKP